MLEDDIKRIQASRDTVRRLYMLSGNQCAFPGCTHPILSDTGVYVGELCHITAAGRRGERFDETKTNEERSKFENLLLLCHDHHVITDNVVEYPIEVMRKMKADHEKRFAVGLASMMETATIQINDSVISLGGEGGKAPGAGGGGGGAIGQNAVGGRGGDGGQTVEVVLEESDLKEIAAFRIQVGNAGVGGDDQNAPTYGEDSVVIAIRHDGSEVELGRAKGGKAPNSAQVSFAILANKAEISNGLITLLSAGWKTYYVNAVEDLMVFDIVYFAKIDEGTQGLITTRIFDPNGHLLPFHEQVLSFQNEETPFVITATALAVLGMWRVELSYGDSQLIELPFEVLLRPIQHQSSL